MKTKDWFARFHLLVVQRQRRPLLLVNLFFRTICRNHRIKSRAKAKIVATGLVALDMILAGVAFGADWTGATSTDWFTGSNWLSGVSPTANDSVVLRTISPFPTVVDLPGAVANQLTVGESPSLPGQSGVGSLTIQSGGVLSVGSANAFIAPSKEGTVTVTGSDSILNIGSNLFVGGSSAGPGGTGLLEITNGGAVNTKTVTIWKTGTLAVNANFTLNTPSLTVDGGTIRTLSNTTFPNSATLAAGGVIIDTNGFDSTFSGVFTGAGGLTKVGPGTLILTSPNTYLGGTTISAGTLELGRAGAFFFLTTGDILGNVTDNGTLAFNRVGSFRSGISFLKFFAGVISGTGSVVQLGFDTLVLTANNTYSGGTIIQSGALLAGTPSTAQRISNALGTGNVFLQGGTLGTSSSVLFVQHPSSLPLTINVGGNYTQGQGGTLVVGVGGINGEDYDRLQVGGNASLNGTLAVNSLNDFHPVNGNAFEVLRTNGSRSGQFAQVSDFLNNNPKLQRIDIYAPNGLALVYVAATTPAPPGTPGGPNPRPPIDIEIPKPLPPVDPEEPLLISSLLGILDPTAEQLTAFYEIGFSGANTQRLKLDERFDDIQRGSTGFVSNLPPVPAPVTGTSGKSVVEKQPVLEPRPQNRWGVWANG